MVGDNSSGKTSLLAATRFGFEAFSRRTIANIFNREPYFLGGFDQIAHYRDRKAGREKEFSIDISAKIKFADQRHRPCISQDGQEVSHRFVFSKGDPQPQLEETEFKFLGYSFRCNLSEDIPKVTILKNKDILFSFQAEGAPPSGLLRENLYFLRYVYGDFRFPRLGGDRGKRPGRELETLGISRAFQSEFYNAYISSFSAFERKVFASSPIRTQPQRTYTPSQLLASSEGSHVPLELARLKLQSPAKWETAQKALVAFGKQAELFTDIDIRRFGRTGIDPFQLIVKNNGPAMNIVDVGYGVSQILPIVYQIQNPSSYTVFLLQQPEVHLHPKAQAALGTFFSAALTQDQFFIIETHSDFLVDRVRTEVARGAIKPEYIMILYFERRKLESFINEIHLDESGKLIDVPRGYRDFFLNESARLLGL